MLAVRRQFQIVWIIVGGIFVYVVNMLIRCQRSSELLGHHTPVDVRAVRVSDVSTLVTVTEPVDVVMAVLSVVPLLVARLLTEAASTELCRAFQLTRRSSAPVVGLPTLITDSVGGDYFSHADYHRSEWSGIPDQAHLFR